MLNTRIPYGPNWIQSATRQTLSAFGIRVAVLLQEWCAVYNISGNLNKADWTNDYFIQFPYRGLLSTFDFNQLTRLVLLCHEHCIRMEISPCNPQHIYLAFTHRERFCVRRELIRGHPTIAQALEGFEVR